jgi:predicted RNA-binding protein with PIN domain
MAYILIDGYNLTGTSHRDLEKVRSGLIQELSGYSDLKGHDITLVFDGWKNGQAVETNIRRGRITIIYSKLGEKADSVIKRIISGMDKEWIVVSSDREISDFAERRDLVSLASDEFEGILFSALHEAGEEDAEEPDTHDRDEDIEEMPVTKKGNPRRMSKKQIRKLRALKKL